MPLLEDQQPRTRRTREEHRAETRQRLFSAAFALFREQGYHATSAEQITDRAGCSTSPLFYMFGTKEGLFIALYEELSERTSDAGRDLGGPGTGLRQALLNYAAYIDSILQDPDYRALHGLGHVIATFATDDTEIQPMSQRLFQRNAASLTDALARAVEATTVPGPMSLDRVARLVLATTSGLLAADMAEASAQGDPLRDLIDLVAPGS